MNVDFYNIISLLKVVVWPAVTVVLVLCFRKEIPKLLQALSGRISGLAAVGVSIQFTAMEPPAKTMRLLDQIKEPSSTGPPPPSGVKPLLELVTSSPQADYLVIDLRDGQAWLTSRLYLFAMILSSVLGIRCFVFVGTRGLVPRSFLGLASPEPLARALETRYSWLRTAMVQAQLYPLVRGDPPHRYTSWSPYGGPQKALKRLVQPGEKGDWNVSRAEALDEIVRALVNPIDLFQPGQVETFVNQFLQNPSLRRPHTTVTQDKDWIQLGAVDEHAEYIKDERHLIDVIGDGLRRDHVVESSTNQEEVIETVILHKRGNFVAVTDSEGRFERLIDRRALLEKAAVEKRR